jgi:LysR family transcriptional regulator, benzoate and cis,cis-muconate-responsive activator of ben and cat genes
MEIRHLRYFLAVAQELHFRKAAEKLFIAQPALSRQIRQLEEKTGVRLFTRTKRSVRLTEAGKYFCREATEILQKLENITQKAKQIDAGTAGKIRIGYVGSAMHSILPKIITRLQKDFPDLHLELMEMPPVAQLQWLREGKIDLAFLRNPPDVDNERISKVVYSETFSLVLPLNHALSEKSFRSLKDVASDKFILIPRSANEIYFDSIVALCIADGFSPEIIHESAYADSIIRLVENNLGISILPSSYRGGFNAKVKFIELKKITARSNLMMFWQKKNDNPALPLITKIAETISANEKRIAKIPVKANKKTKPARSKKAGRSR